MTTRPDGGAAFPRPAANGLSSQDGMTLRDWFAGQALVGFTSAVDSDGQWTSPSAMRDAVFNAYAFADAMIVERNK